jgi:glycosyltransferase involved in cell wall biosynthesis
MSKEVRNATDLCPMSQREFTMRNARRFCGLRRLCRRYQLYGLQCGNVHTEIAALAMIVDQFNTILSGGAAIAARRHHHSLLDAGITSRFRYLNRKQQEDAGDDTYVPADSLWTDPGSSILSWPQKGYRKFQFKRALRRRPSGLEMFSSPQVIPRTRVDTGILDMDIIHLHWVAKMIDYASFFDSLPNDFPVVWTLHDMNPFTGGCHYAGTCEAFRHECRNCPQLGHSHEQDLSRRFFNAKLAAIRGQNLHIVTPSHWLEREARSSHIFASARSVQTIHYGLDTDLYTPHDKRDARRQLGLRDDGVVIGFGAESLDSHRKGFRELLQTLPQLQTKARVYGLAFGGGKIDDSQSGLPEITTMGYVRDPQRQALIYSAADIFVMPSLEDNLPQTGLEAMACGTPVVAFETGGVPDYVHHERTGLLAKLGDTADLAHQISRLVNRTEERRRLAVNARELLVREFHHHKQAAKYISFYRDVLSVRAENSRHAA